MKKHAGSCVSHGTEEKPVLTREELVELLSYDPGTGVFRWRVNRAGGVKAGDVAGTTSNSKGYRLISIKGTKYLAHRVAFFIMTGEWPEKFVDHIDGDRANNAWSNLRDVSNAQNQENRTSANKNNVGGFLGVSPASRGRGYQAQIRARGKNYHLGFYESPELASAVYLATKKLIHEFGPKLKPKK